MVVATKEQVLYSLPSSYDASKVLGWPSGKRARGKEQLKFPTKSHRHKDATDRAKIIELREFSGVISSFYGDPVSKNSKGVNGYMEEKEKKVSYDSLDDIPEATEVPPLFAYETPQEMAEFCQSCETFYRRSTEDHLEWYKNQKFEGHPDFKLWYTFAIYLLEKEGWSFEQISGSKYT